MAIINAQNYSESALYRIRHSLAHIMAQAVLEQFPNGKIAIGPPIENGFYYDFDLPRTLTEGDLVGFEARMREIVQEGSDFVYEEVNPEHARELFRDQPYKLELIDEILKLGTDEYGEKTENPVLSTYTNAPFVDLCRGPHVGNATEIKPDAFKLLSVAGAYWRGDETRPMLQRIYGTAWESPAELEHYLWQRSEAEKRDHRRLGKELELFHLDPTAPGMPYWLPNGLTVLNTLLEFWRAEHEKRGYREVATPQINSKSLYETSGHWEHYKDNMFIIPIDEHTTYCVKPMNCPNAMIVYNLKTRSYRDLPLRISDSDILYRNERSGQLHGLLRVQHIQQDDSHNFVAPDQIESEYDQILDIADLFYGIFGLKYTPRLGTRPIDGYIGDLAAWDQAESALLRIIDKRYGEGNYIIGEGEGAFYGPKIDIMMEDALGRLWQMGTLQLDFQLPARFNCTYTDKDGFEKTPVVIHRVVYGSLERFLGILIEHTNGVFPVWLAPVQARVIPVTDAHISYAQEVADQLRKENIRVEVDDSNNRMGAKIRDAQLQRVPYMLVVGKREIEQQTVSIRLRNEDDLGAMSLESFIPRVKKIIAQKELSDWVG